MDKFLNEQFFPFWLSYGIDDIGGFQERLQLDLTPYRDENKKRVLVQFRQIFVFSKAFELTKDSKYIDAAKSAVAFVLDKYWDKDRGGFFHALDLNLEVKHSNRNLYDHAFALFSFGHFYNVTKDNGVRDWIYDIHEFIQSKFKAELGYFESLNQDNVNISTTREQNPHMHLLEGYLCLYEFFGEKKYLDCSRELVQLFSEKMVDSKNGGVVEFFTQDWNNFDPELGDKIEPGHCYEWAWLLGEFERLSSCSEYRQLTEKIYNFGFSFGQDTKFGGIFNEVSREGVVLDTNKRIWPETEAIKAHLAMYKLKGDDKYIQRALVQFDFLKENRLNENGSWSEHLKQDLSDATDVYPSTTAYHLLMAMLELKKYE